MNDKHLDELEKDVARARARVMARMEALRRPRLYGDAKAELTTRARTMKDDLVAQARTQATGQATGLVESLKERAAANPAAVLAIGAGLAWQIYKHPPVTTILVGAGLYALLRDKSGMHVPRYEPYGGSAPSSYVPGGVAGYGYPVASEPPAKSLVEQGREMAQAATNRATEWARETGQAVTEKVAGVVDQGRSQVNDWRSAASDMAGGMVGDLGQNASEQWERRRRQARAMLPESGNDTLLLGLAAMAVGSALAISMSRRSSPPRVEPQPRRHDERARVEERRAMSEAFDG